MSVLYGSVQTDAGRSFRYSLFCQRSLSERNVESHHHTESGGEGDNAYI